MEMILGMSEWGKTVAFLTVWSGIMTGVPGFFATRAVLTGWIYAGRRGASSFSGEWISRETSPVRFWAWVVFYYLFALSGFVPWVLLFVFGLKKH